MDMTLPDQLVHSTALIQCVSPDGQPSTGTGFFYQFLRDDDAHISVPALVTNKHVVEGVNSWSFTVTKSVSGDQPILGERLTIDFYSNAGWIPHPDPNIDLTIFLLGPTLKKIEKERGIGLYYVNLTNSNLVTDELNAELTAIEPVLMVGYPIGLWDSTNNLPVARRGITASPYSIDHDGRSEFLIDAACFPGSSGSPVFLYNDGPYFKDGSLIVGTRFAFLGVLYAGPVYNASGEISVESIPTTATPVSRTAIPINIGYCIKSNRLLDFEPILERLRSSDTSDVISDGVLEDNHNS
ncbi:MAG: serine protease [Alphaproteobacteria bacterium]|nr:serine protease [Alphaproteobacteria bacterium]